MMLMMVCILSGDEDVEDRKSIDTYHNWIYDAVKDHTGKRCRKRNTCVRVLYADGHHIDLPIYYKMDEDDSIRISAQI